jgi:hypothetical protein
MEGTMPDIHHRIQVAAGLETVVELVATGRSTDSGPWNAATAS